MTCSLISVTVCLKSRSRLEVALAQPLLDRIMMRDEVAYPCKVMARLTTDTRTI
jgi:hypothetical protein